MASTLLKNAWRANEDAIIAITLLIQGNIQGNTLSESDLSDILSANKKEHRINQYLKACVYAFGTGIKQDGQRALDILNNLVEKYNDSYAMNLISILYGEGMDNKAADVWFKKAISHKNPLALYNYTNSEFDKLGYFTLDSLTSYALIEHLLPEKYQKSTAVKIYNFEHQLVKGKTEEGSGWSNREAIGNVESKIKHWLSLAAYFDHTDPSRAKNARLYAMSYGSVEAHSKLTEPLINMSEKQRLSLMTDYENTTKAIINKLEAIQPGLKDMNVHKLNNEVTKNKMTLEKVKAEFEYIKLLNEIYHDKAPDNIKDKIKLCENLCREVEASVKKANDSINENLISQMELGEKMGYVSEKNKGIVGTVGDISKEAAKIAAQRDNLKRDKEKHVQALKTMQHLIVKQIDDLSGEIDDLSRQIATAKSSDVTFFKPKGKSYLSSNLIETLHFDDDQFYDKNQNANKLLSEDVGAIKLWLLYREESVDKKHPAYQDFQALKSKLLRIADTLEGIAEGKLPEHVSSRSSKPK